MALAGATAGAVTAAGAGLARRLVMSRDTVPGMGGLALVLMPGASVSALTAGTGATARYQPESHGVAAYRGG